MAKDLQAIDPAWAWAPYAPSAERPWNRRLAAHLYRRAGFGATRGELAAAESAGPQKTLELLLDAVEDEGYRNDTLDLRAAAKATGETRQGAAWWLHRMLTSPCQVREKLTLFWHGHFATGDEKVSDLTLMLLQNDLLREHALGDFGALAHGIARDPAMLIYLDSATNRKAHPNENFARELMELFCLGEGNYSEQDVQQLARCFTGWEVKRKRFRFNPYQHDDGVKTLLGAEGALSGEEAVDVVLQQEAVGDFIASKLARFYVADLLPESPEFLAPLAATFRESKLQVRPLLQRILGSNMFYSEHGVGRKIRSPIELALGVLRCLEGRCDVVSLAGKLQDLGHGLFFPPNVKGWDGGKTWINTSTLIGRANLVRELLQNERTRFAGKPLDEYLRSAGAAMPEQLQALTELMLAVPLDDDVSRELLELATGAGDVSPAEQLLYTFASLAEFQLS